MIFFDQLLVGITLLEINLQDIERAFKMFSSVPIGIPCRNLLWRVSGWLNQLRVTTLDLDLSLGLDPKILSSSSMLGSTLAYIMKEEREGGMEGGRKKGK